MRHLSKSDEPSKSEFDNLSYSKCRETKTELESVKRKLSALTNKLKSMEVDNAKRQRLEQQNSSKKKSRREENNGKHSVGEIEKIIAECASNIGGLTRFTMFSDVFHKNNPTCASTLFGFPPWSETKHYVELFFGLTPPVHAMQLD